MAGQGEGDMLKKGHEFNQKSKRQKVKRKQRRKDAEFDRATVKQRKGIISPSKPAPVKKQKKAKKPDDRVELSDANLKEVMSRYALVDVDSDRPLAVGQPREVIKKIEQMRAEGKNVYDIFKELGIPIHTHSKE